MTDYSRQLDDFDPSTWHREVHLFGVGGSGSTILLQMMRMGVPEVNVYDDDIVELHNIPYQPLYRNSDAKARRLKVDAAELYAEREELDTRLVKHVVRVGRLTRRLKLEGVVICAFDSIESRKHLWKHVRGNGMVELFMDTRIGGKGFQLHALNPSSPTAVKKYEAWLHPTNGISPLPCGARGINQPPYMLAGLVGSTLASFSRGEPYMDLLKGNLGAVARDGRKVSVVHSL